MNNNQTENIKDELKRIAAKHSACRFPTATMRF